MVTGTYSGLFTSDCNKLLATGWDLQGGIAMQYNLGTYIFAQAFIKHPEVDTWRRNDSDERNFATRDEACTNEYEPGGW